MKNSENTRLLAHKRNVDAQRKAAAIAKRDAANVSAMHKVGGTR